MKYFILLLIFSFFIIQINPILPPKIRQDLLNKLTKKISPSNNLGKDYPEFNSDLSEDYTIMRYDVLEIQKLMSEYDLPESFNFFNQTGAEIIVKDQGNCGSCWSFSATSALAYRYKKYGININLSPQDGISCYLPICESGNIIIDSQLNLVKNGTLTEQCFPYASKDGKTIPKCPSACQDGSEFKKYHAQNAYMAENNYQEKFYDLVILIMDQLITEGPIIGGFYIYDDFYDFGENKEKCLNDIYTYDGYSDIHGAHGVTITGYGLFKNKFYWLIQNSWGENWCNNGFIKMEIGQFFGIAFSEPNIPPEHITPIDIDVSFVSKDIFCNLVVKTSSSLDYWKNTLNIKFTHENGLHDIEFQIGKNKIKGKEEINSYYELRKIYIIGKKGKYMFNGYESLGVENTFILNSFKGEYFNYYGNDFIYYYNYQKYYISQVGRKVVFRHIYSGNDDSLPPIYMKKNHLMNNCHKLNTSTKLDINLAYCEITQDNFDYIKKNPKARVYYQTLCGYFYNSEMILDILDTKLYPVFKIIKFLKPTEEILSQKTELIIVANITKGSGQFFQSEIGQFNIIIEIENKNENKTDLAWCKVKIDSQNEESNLICNLQYASATYQYENLYLLPYSMIVPNKTPFDVIIETTIKAENGPEPEPTDPDTSDPTPKPEPTPIKSSYLEFSLNLLLSLKLLLF